MLLVFCTISSSAITFNFLLVQRSKFGSLHPCLDGTSVKLLGSIQAVHPRAGPELDRVSGINHHAARSLPLPPDLGLAQYFPADAGRRHPLAVDQRAISAAQIAQPRRPGGIKGYPSMDAAAALVEGGDGHDVGGPAEGGGGIG